MNVHIEYGVRMVAHLDPASQVTIISRLVLWAPGELEEIGLTFVSETTVSTPQEIVRSLDFTTLPNFNELMLPGRWRARLEQGCACSVTSESVVVT